MDATRAGASICRRGAPKPVATARKTCHFGCRYTAADISAIRSPTKRWEEALWEATVLFKWLDGLAIQGMSSSAAAISAQFKVVATDRWGLAKQRGDAEMRFLPKLGDRLTDLHPTTLAIALNNFAAVTGGNEIHDAREGNLRWLGKTMRISNVGVVNYCYIPAVPNKVSFGVVDCGAGGPDFYVISDQYGGCELHELYNPLYNQLAFLHVFRGGGDITQYTRGAGWRAGNVKRSAVIAGRHRIVGSNLSVSVVLRGSIPPLVRSKFIHIDNAPMIPAQGFQNTPGFVPAQMSSYSTVTGEDEGDSMYS